jgi:hypothetical protein
MTKMLAALAAALLTCAPAMAQNIAKLPAASPLTGTEKMTAAQGAGCPVAPCANVAISPAQISTYLAPTFQAKDADLDAIAALSTVDYGRQLLTKTDAAAVRSYLGVTSGGTGTGSVTSVSVASANGVSGTVANASTTPAITLALGAITPTSVVASGGGRFTGNGTFGGVTLGTSAQMELTGPTFAYLVLDDRSAGTGRRYAFGSGFTRPGVFGVYDYTSGTTRLEIDGTGTLLSGADNGQALGSAPNRWANVFTRQIRPGSGAPIWTSGAGTPLGSISAPVGSLYTRTDGGAASTLYVKESGTDASGWVAK